MKEIPNITGEYRDYEFDKDAQGAFEFYFKIEQNGSEISIFYRVFDPYDRKTSEKTITGQIIGFDERIKTVKIKSKEGNYYLFDYEKGNFARGSYMNVIRFDLDKNTTLKEKFNLLLDLSNIAVSGILKKEIMFSFPQKFEQNGLSYPIIGYRLQKKINVENEDVFFDLITHEQDLFTFKTFVTGKRNGEIINYAFAEIQYFPTELVKEIFSTVKKIFTEKYGKMILW